MLIGMAREIPGGVIGKGNFLKGRVRRTLLFFFLVMYSAIPFFFEKHAMFLLQLVRMLLVNWAC